MPKLRLIFIYFLIGCALVAGAYYYSLQSGFTRLAQTGQVRIDQASDRLLGQLSSFKQLPNILSRHPVLQSAFDADVDKHNISSFLENTALLSGAREIFIVDTQGKVVAQSNVDAENGRSLSGEPFLRAAMNGRLGTLTALDRTSGERTIFIARGMRGGATKLRGAIVIAVDIPTLEFEWHVDEEALAFFDENEVAFIANRQNIALRRIPKIDEPLKNNHRYLASQLRPFFGHKQRLMFGQNIWRFDNNTQLPQEALVVAKPIPRLEMVARVFLPTKAARDAARLQAGLVGAILFALGMILWGLWQRRQRLADQLAIEAAANATLEARVEKRTEQLKQMQHQLIQAGKLTALGEMSAGISHELNQPLAAMQNFAENGAKMLARDRVEDARKNFGLITEQIDRVTRIIRSLRAFARREKETVEPVDLQAVLSESLNLAQARISAANVEVLRNTGASPVMVMGGHVRLQQVVINLLTNALDAMETQTDKCIEIDLQQSPQSVDLIIRDTGNGLIDPTRVFEPFYSTKDVGASKGMGLGLSISYGIVGTFGGEMACHNHPDGGAEFIVTLRKATS
jgi:two-component system C4-dicarboxylate transport sensor histidine kinase DctB